MDAPDEPVRASTDWAAEYKAIRPKYVAFTDALEKLVDDLLSETPIEVSQIEARTKSVRSFSEKSARKSYVEPLKETTDFVGIRVIVYDPADCEGVGRLISDAFDVDEDKSTSWTVDADPERFGYRSDHYQVSLLPERCGLHEWRKFAELDAEIQVRTVMQHAWAAVEHKIGYKKEGLPSDIRHRLSRLSALLELADREFAETLSESRALENRHAKSIAEGEFGAGIDALSLTAFLDKTDLGHTWSQRAVALDYLEPRSDHFDVTTVLHAARAVGLHTLGDLQELFARIEDQGEGALQEILEITLAGWPADHPFAGIPAHQDRILVLLLLAEAGDAQAVESCALRADIKDALLQMIQRRDQSVSGSAGD